jgi:hypothetical protein
LLTAGMERGGKIRNRIRRTRGRSSMRGTKALRRRTPAAGLLAGGIWGESSFAWAKINYYRDRSGSGHLTALRP